jgi:hypothetical protein
VTALNLVIRGTGKARPGVVRSRRG